MAKKNNEAVSPAGEPEQEAPNTPQAPMEPEAANAVRSRLTPRTRTVLCVCLGVLLGVAIAGGTATALLSARTADKAEQLETGQMALVEKVDQHAHTWVPNYATVHHDAVYKDVWHEPVYESVTTYHTVCNDCKKTIDGVASDHIEDTGHSGYSTNVPITNEVLKQAGYNEPVLVSEGYDEAVIEGVTCTGCGETMDADQAAEAGVSIPEADS